MVEIVEMVVKRWLGFKLSPSQGSLNQYRLALASRFSCFSNMDPNPNPRTLFYFTVAFATRYNYKINTTFFDLMEKNVAKGILMNRVFVDMDGVIVDFDAYKTAQGLSGDEVKCQPGAYLAMPAIHGALEAVRSVIGMGFEVWIATKPPTGVTNAYSDKAAWVIQYLPELRRRIIVTHDKGLLGDSGDYLCDDRPHKANCERFSGTLLRFMDGYHWPQALEFFRSVRSTRRLHDGISSSLMP